jgi:hypothetical protein
VSGSDFFFSTTDEKNSRVLSFFLLLMLNYIVSVITKKYFQQLLHAIFRDVSQLTFVRNTNRWQDDTKYTLREVQLNNEISTRWQQWSGVVYGAATSFHLSKL